MEKRSSLSFGFALKSYLMLTKPGIIFGNAVTAIGGFALASRSHFDVPLFFAMLEGLCLIVAAGCVFNNYIDREKDEKMARTKNRALAKGLISPRNALLFGIALGLFGAYLLASFTNLATVSAALLGLLVYVFWYSFAKYRTVHGTLIGSIAGAIPPVVGYCAVTGRLDAAAVILFAIIVLWQMPHFYAIAIYRMQDYAAASIPVLPIVKGLRATKVQMILYIIAFITASAMLTALGYTGNGFLIVASLLGAAWLWLGIKGFKCASDKMWARKMFIFSLVVVMVQSIMIPLSVN